MWTFANARAEPTPRRLTMWVIGCALALATHYYALLLVAPEALWLLIDHRRERRVLIALGALGLCGAALLPLAVSQNGTGHASWIAPIALDGRLEQIVPVFLVGFQLPAGAVLEPVAKLLVALALVLVVLRRQGRDAAGRARTAAIALGGLVINLRARSPPASTTSLRATCSRCGRPAHSPWPQGSARAGPGCSAWWPLALCARSE